MSAKIDAGGDAAALALIAALGAADGGGLGSYVSGKRALRAAVAQDPFDAMVVMVVGGAFLFYVAEKGHNEKVRTYWDALVFVSTCASVGYADVFARTPAGKAIASAVMTFGPALSGAVFEEPGASDAPPAALSAEMRAVKEVIVAKLDAILGELRAARARA
ncbi:MAG: ion channel [Polyangiaceae bacterium]|jgi:hypothetical protein